MNSREFTKHPGEHCLIGTMMAEGHFPVLIQPVYDKRLNWNGFILTSHKDDHISASALSPLAEEWADFKAKTNFRCFIPFNPDWLNTEIPTMPFPADQVTFVLQSQQTQDDNLMTLCKTVKAKGFRFAVSSDADSVLARNDLTNISLLPAAEAKEKLPVTAWRKIEQSELKLFATGIDSMELFKWCAAQGFVYYTFAALNGSQNNKDQSQGSSKVILMKLLTLISQDAETHELELVLRREPKLAFDLLRLVNSASMGIRTKVTSFGHALTILGRRQLQRWMQLLLFAHRKEGTDGPSVLMQRAAARGRLMELLTKSVSETPTLEFQEQAFMAGVFSLLDILMGMPLEELMKTLLLADSVEAALLRREGLLGEMLNLVDRAERLDFDAAAQSLDKLKISPDAFCHAQAAALLWTYRLDVV